MRLHSTHTDLVAKFQPPAPQDGALREAMACFFGQRAEAAVRLAYHLTRDREAALDLSQEAVVRAMESTPPGHSSEQIRIWFNRIVVNLCRDWIRRKGAERRALKVHAGTREHAGEDPTAAAGRREAAERMREAVFQLPDDLREVIVLVCIESFTPLEAAETIGIPDGTLRWRLHEGRKLLKEAYDKSFPEER